MEENRWRESLIKEAEILYKEHPSKDIRFFANNVFKYLLQEKEKEEPIVLPNQLELF